MNTKARIGKWFWNQIIRHVGRENLQSLLDENTEDFKKQIIRCTCVKEKRIVTPPNERRELEKIPSKCGCCGLLLEDKFQPWYVNLKSLK